MQKKYYRLVVITVGTMLLAGLSFLSAPVQADNAAEATYKWRRCPTTT
jgi:hypothetical protein